MLDAFGGAQLPRVMAADRPAAAADLVEAHLASGDSAAAEVALMVGEHWAARTSGRWAAATVAVARSAVLLARGRPDEAVRAAAVAREAATDAPLSHARAQLAEGRALAAAGNRAAAIKTLIAAEAALDGLGALRRRNEAVRALRQLGHRVVRPAAGAPAADPLGPLTAREREISELVAAGRSNREIAAQLVLSTRTIEAHLRTVYAKLGVRTRLELARALDAAGR
jgi:DNA-binding NarL/FixJ family response regulator